jgi:hypothetical protein
MTLHAILKQAQIGVAFHQASNPDVEFRVVVRQTFVTYKTVECRFYPDKRNCWSDWDFYAGFDMDEILAEDWELV